MYKYIYIFKYAHTCVLSSLIGSLFYCNNKKWFVRQNVLEMAKDSSCRCQCIYKSSFPIETKE